MRTLLIILLLAGSLAAMPLGGSESQPPRDIHLVEKKFDQLSNRDVDSLGSRALAIAPAKWKHAETDNFIIHYRRVTEAQRVVREIEFDLWFVANSLNATKDKYSKKSHVYIFQDEREWAQFVMDNCKEHWAASFANAMI